MITRFQKKRGADCNLEIGLQKKAKNGQLDSDSVGSTENLPSEEETVSKSESNSDSDSDSEDDENMEEKIKEIDPDAYENLEKVKEELSRTEPSIIKILKEPLRLEDKAKLVQYYEIYKSQIPNTEEWLGVRETLNKMFENFKAGYIQHKKYTREQHTEMEEEIKQFSSHDSQLALKYKIMGLQTSRENKEVIFQRYQEFTELNTRDDEYGKIKNWLTWAVDVPHDNLKEFPFQQCKLTEFLQGVSRKMDAELYGMKKVKEQILIFLNAKILNPEMRRCNLGLIGPPGVGKCLARDTPIIMFNGSIKKVQDIVVGDKIMGDDSLPRNVLSLARGQEQMYKIKQNKGDDYIVNESHILSLKLIKTKKDIVHIGNKKYKKGDIVDINVLDYIQLSNHKKSCLKGFKVGVEFADNKTPFDPYIIGLWLGDDSSSCSKITIQDSKVIYYLYNILPSLRMTLQYQSQYDYRLNGINQVNPFFNVLNDLNLVNNKHIPDIYKINSRQNRLKILAGIIDSEGNYVKHTNTYEITQKNKVLMNDIVFLCRSLGFYTSVVECKEGDYQRAHISGYGLEEIPVLIHRKQARNIGKIENALHTVIDIEPRYIDDYYGFTIDGNHRFLLGDFTVTHNTAISKLLASVMDFPFEQISFGGVSNPDFLKGHEYTYVGAQPGEIVKCLKRMKYKNGILFLDEYEKIADNKDLCSALLHITDPVQNYEYRDHFLSEITLDLSHLWFIYSMNSHPEDSALRDRIFSIEVPGYTAQDKINIVEKYLLPKTLKNVGLDTNSIIMSAETISTLINKVCGNNDKGVRTIEKTISDLVNKINFLANHQDDEGNLVGFNMSFDVGRKITYPLLLTRKLVNKFVESNELSYALHMMYI